MQEQDRLNAGRYHESWRGYQEKLRNAVAPLTNEQLVLQPAAHMWPLGQMRVYC